jgi:hypothetical protein
MNTSLWSGAGSNRRPSAFQVNHAKRCADLQERTSLTSGTALGGRCSVHASRTQYTRPQGRTPTPRTTATVVGVIMVMTDDLPLFSCSGYLKPNAFSLVGRCPWTLTAGVGCRRCRHIPPVSAKGGAPLPIGTLAQDMRRLLHEASRDDSAHDKTTVPTTSCGRGRKARRAARVGLCKLRPI